MPAVGKYEILDPLGTGSMGTVYRARDTLLDRIVALKTIRTGIDVEPESRKRFYREARTCARLQHPHIVTIFELGEEERTAFISMELLTGSDLRQVIQQRQPLSLSTKLQVMAQICEALGHAHREGVIHRDVKPSNLFLLTDKRAKVLDFGIARLPSSRLTMTGRVLGTPNYMSPEQVQGQPCDGRSDLFSAGIVFFELLVYTHPFRSPLIPRRVVQGEPDSIFDHDSSMPVLLDQVFARALAKDPEKRYSTGDEFAADLRAVLDAIQLNSSPTFSNVELPSTRAAVSPAPPKPPLLGDAAGEDDPDERRLNEILRLLPDFEAVLERKDKVAAQRSLVALQEVAGDDPRFREALENCRIRVFELETGRTVPSPRDTRTGTSTMEPGQPGKDDSLTATKTCPACNAANRKAAAFCIDCGEPFGMTVPQMEVDSTVLFAPQVSTGGGAAAQTARAPSDSPRTVEMRPAFAERWRELKAKATPVLARFAAAPASWKERFSAATTDQKRLALVGAGLVVCILLLTVVAEMSRPVRVEPVVASAVVEPANAAVLETAGNPNRVVATLHHGDRVDLLKIPSSREQEWIRVQPKIGRKIFRPGYIRTADVKAVTAANPKDELALIRMFHRGEQGADEEIRSEIDSLNSLASKVYGTPVQREAAVEALGLELVLARRAKERNEPPSVWQGILSTFPARLTELRGDPALDGKLSSVEAQAKDLLKETTLASDEPKPDQGDSTVKGDVPLLHDAPYYLNHAEAAWSESDWKQARHYAALAAKAGADKGTVDNLLNRIKGGEAIAEAVQH